MKVLNKEISEKLLSKIISDIKDKPQFKNIEESFVKDLLKKELEKDSKLIDFIVKHNIKNLDRSEKYKNLIKRVRSILHKSYGVFLTYDSKKLNEFMLKLKEAIDISDNPMKIVEEHEKVLSTHRSTKERLKIYPKLYWAIWSITGKPRKIIDLSAGLNPLSFPWMGLNNVDYLATELNKSDCDVLNSYFGYTKKFGLFGLAIQLDLQQVLRKPEILTDLPKSDICFLFKVLDSIELTKSHKISEIIISTVPTRWVVISFPVKTIGNKPMSSTRHVWVEKMCERLDYKFKRIILKTESFYIIEKPYNQ